MRRFVLLLMLLLPAVGSVQAQGDMIGPLGVYIDTHVELQGFPTTGSQIQAVRQEIAQNISNEIDHVVDQIIELDSTAVGREYVEAVDAAADGSTPLTSAQQYLQTRPRSNPFDDSRPTVPEYDGIDSEIVRRINDAVRDIFRSEDGGELPTYQPSDQPHQRTRMEDLMERYGREIAAIQGELALNEQQRRLLAEAVADGASAAIDVSNVDHRNLVKRIIRRYVQVMTASQELPIGGYWRMPPVEFSRSGACEIYTGDNGGMAPITKEEWPTYPLCGYDPGDALPFLVWQGDEATYIPGTSSIYSPASTVEIQVARDSNGATLRSVRTTHAVEYEVVAPDRIVVRESFIEEGGCSLSAEYTIELASQDETVCNIMEIPPEPEETDDDPTVPPGETRTMRAGSPLFQDASDCDASNTPPSFEDVTLTAGNDGSLVLDYGSGTQTLYGNGRGFYEFNTGSGSAREIVTVSLYDSGQQGNLRWLKRNSASEPECSVSQRLTMPDADVSDTPVETPVDNGDSDDDFGVLIPGEYSVDWIEVEGLCPAEMKSQAPQFETAMLGAPSEGAAVMQAGDAQFDFALVAAGTYIGSAPTDNGRIDISLTTVTPGEASFAWTWSADDGQMCMVMASLTKIV